MKSRRSDEVHPSVGTWKVLASTCRFLPVSALLRVSAGGREGPRAVLEWPDAEPVSGLELFVDGETAGDRLSASFVKPDPHGSQELACFFSMVRQPRGAAADLAYGVLVVEQPERGDTSTGTFVAEETDPDDRG